MSWAGPEDVYLSTSLASYLDKKLLVLLRDGRKLMGILRSFDQFGFGKGGASSSHDSRLNRRN
ncbi:Sm-like protein LSM1B [Linum grandiflorum]